MVVAQLYKTVQGRVVTTHSHSAGQDFGFCRRFYKLRRVDGYRPVGQRGSLEFGKCIEEAIQRFYTENQRPGSGTDELKRLWLKWEKVELQFTKKEGSWRDLYTMGAEMIRLFEILAPTLPIHKPAFQVAYRKEVFPGTHLAGLEDVGYADIISRTPKGLLLIDVKTTANPYNLAAEFVAMDPQLGRYSWHSGIRDVAFMTFVKARPDSFKSGDLATLLISSGNWTAGSTGAVFPLPPPKKPKTKKPTSKEVLDETVEGLESAGLITATEAEEIVGPRQITLVSEDAYAKFEIEAKDVRGKALEEKKIAFFAEHGVTVPREDLTKQRVQFLQGRIPEELVQNIEHNVKRQMAEIEQAGRLNDFPMEPDVRPPYGKCTRCEMRSICIGDEKGTAERLVQIHVNPTERDWLDELESEL